MTGQNGSDSEQVKKENCLDSKEMFSGVGKLSYDGRVTPRRHPTQGRNDCKLQTKYLFREFSNFLLCSTSVD